jgi:hypothetical protein
LAGRHGSQLAAFAAFSSTHFTAVKGSTFNNLPFTETAFLFGKPDAIGFVILFPPSLLFLVLGGNRYASVVSGFRREGRDGGPAGTVRLAGVDEILGLVGSLIILAAASFLPFLAFATGAWGGSSADGGPETASPAAAFHQQQGGLPIC